MAAKTNKQYEEIGRMVESIYETGHPSRKAVYRNSFLKGLFSGFGGVLGATILIALLIWFLTLFHRVPLLGPLTNRIEDTVQKSNLKR